MLKDKNKIYKIYKNSVFSFKKIIFKKKRFFIIKKYTFLKIT
jgi:hypothetical protein